MARSRLFAKISGALFIGVCGVLLYLQDSDFFVRFIENGIKTQIESAAGCSFQGKVSRVSLFSFSAHMENVRFIPRDPQEGWAWQTAGFECDISLLSYLYTGKIGLTVTLEKGHAFSEVKNGYPLILNHVNKLMGGMPSSAPLALRALVFKDFELVVADLTSGVNVTLVSNGTVGRSGNAMKSRFSLVKGNVKVKDLVVCSDISGTVIGFFDTSLSVPAYRITTDVRTKIVSLPATKQDCVLEGEHTPSYSAFTLYNHDRSFIVEPFRFYTHQSRFVCEGSLVMPLSYACGFMGMGALAQNVQGSVRVAVNGDPMGSLVVTGTVSDPRYNGHGLDAVELSCVTEGWKSARGSLTLKKGEGLCSGTCTLDGVTKTIRASLVNHTSWPLLDKGRWAIQPHEGKIECSITGENKTEVSYQVSVHDAKTATTFSSHGNVLINEAGTGYATGTLGDNHYIIRSELFPKIKPLLVSYSDKDGKELLHCAAQAPEYKAVEGVISYDVMRTLLKEYFDYDLSGQGTFFISGAYEADQLRGHIHAENAAIRLPETYNFLSDFSADMTVSLWPITIKIYDVMAQLHKGRFSCKEAIIHVSGGGDEITFLHIPWKFSECFLNWKDDLFVVGSGSCLFQKRKGRYFLDGYVVIEKGQLKENPLSKSGQTQLTQFMVPTSLSGSEDITIDVSVMTKEPLTIRTPQLTSHASCDIHVTNTLRKPAVSGTLRLLGGQVHFPYKPLHITRADVTFQPLQPYDPLIDLVLQGTLKKYAVTVTVGGSVNDPHITFDSVPGLQDEQIVSLLLSGTAEESLNVVIPSLVARNIETVLFGAARDTVAQSWLDPLKRIRIVPSFADQTGRGGLRGALEIDVSDHLHATIQKNFSLSEDTRVEIEYLVSDDIALKAIKDERSDIGGEVEMRFKF